MFENDVLCVIISAEQGKLQQIIDCNRNFEIMYKKTKEQIIKTTIDQYMPAIFARDHEKMMTQYLSTGKVGISY